MNLSFDKVRVTVLLLGLNFLAVAAFAQSKKAESSVGEIASFQGADRLQRLLEGAKKEGELNLYGSMTAGDMVPIVEAFSKKYGIKVNNWRSGSENVLKKVISEAQGGRFEVDVVENNAPEMEALHREKLLQPVKSPYHDDLMRQALPAHREWAGTFIDVFVQGYNTDKVKKEELPQAYEDLLDSKWKGRLGIEAEDQHWFAAVVQELGQEKGETLFKNIVNANGMSVRKGHALLAQMVASGEVPLGLTLYSHTPAQLKEKGARIDWFVIPPAIAQFRTIGILKKAPHPHAAMLFYEFMLSEGQQILSKRHYVPTGSKIDSPLKKLPLKFIDPGLFLNMNDKWIKTYEESVTKRAKQ